MTMAILTIVLFVLGILQISKVNGFRRWNDDSIEPDFFDIRKDCLSEDCTSMFPEKRDVDLGETIEKPRQVAKMIASYHIMGRPWQVSCSCETQYDILDLGVENYPRYLATARCAPKACYDKFDPCRLIHYKVHILRQRDTSMKNINYREQQYVEQVPLPESLRTKWQMKPMKIAVACVVNEGKNI